MGTPPIPLARHEPDPAMQAYEQLMHQLTKYVRNHNIMDWESCNVWIAYAEALREAAMDEQDSPAPVDDSVALDWAMRAKIISPNEARIRYGYSAREAADALMVMTTSGPVLWPGEASNEIDGMALCGYEEL